MTLVAVAPVSCRSGRTGPELAYTLAVMGGREIACAHLQIHDIVSTGPGWPSNVNTTIVYVGRREVSRVLMRVQRGSSRVQC